MKDRATEDADRMPEATARGQSPSGLQLIRFFVRHPTAANLLMMAMIAIGMFGFSQLNAQFLPTIRVPVILVSVAWPGSSAADVESQILDALEPDLRFIDGISETGAIAREGSGLISLEFDAASDMQKAQADVERAVSLVTTLPIGAERPQVQRVTLYEPVARLAITGPFSESVLKYYARAIRDGLLAAGIDQVEMVGLREEEIAVLVPARSQRQLDISIAEIAKRIGQGIQNIPSGTFESDREVQLRSVVERRNPDEIGDMDVRVSANGENILLRDIAAIETRFDREAAIGEIGGNPAIELRVKRAVAADTLETMAIVDRFVAEIDDELPPSLSITKYDVKGRQLVQRLAILVENGILGLLLVLGALAIFLNLRTAIWVALGIPIALTFSFGIMWLTGQTLDMVSLFALIMMIGIIVDDAIVVGEQAATLRQRGLSAIAAAEGGARRMYKPVMAATLTTLLAFLPIITVSGPIGEVMKVIPLVVIAVLVASTMECFLVLPAHLTAFRHRPIRPSRMRRAFDDGLARFRDGRFREILEVCYVWRYSVASFLLALLIVLAGVAVGGRIKFHFFPSPEAEVIRASVVFTPGLPLAAQRDALAAIEDSLGAVERRLTGESQETLVEATFTTIGSFEAFERIRLQNVAQIEIELTPSERRSIPTTDFVAAWRDAIPPIAGVTRIALTELEAGPPGRQIEIRLQDAPTADLKAAAEEIADALRRFDGVVGIMDDLPHGKPEILIDLTRQGRSLGFTAEDAGTQLRGLVEGAVAHRFARDDEVVSIKVLGDGRDASLGFGALGLRSPEGAWVPLDEAVTWQEVDSFSLIRHSDGKRTVTVSADILERITSASRVVAALQEDVLPSIAERHGVRYAIAGQSEDRSQAFSDLTTGALLAIAMIYVVLAFVFESYTRPVVVMVIIPFGAVGAVVGHVLTGMDVTVVSLVGLLGLTGILVNDSIILIDRVSQRLRNGEDVREAAISASQDRFRAILLTSITTILGLLPLLFETSRQAQFLIPLAVTMVFGLALATIIVPILVPVLFGIGSDLRGITALSQGSWRRHGRAESHAD